MALKNETILNDFKINCLSDELYKEAVRNGEINPNEIYLTPATENKDKVEWNDILNKPSSMPASDVYSWAKASHKPTYTKSEVGLGNVDNTADSTKSVNYANTSGVTSRLGTNTEGSSISPIYLNNGYPNACTYTLGKSVPSDAVFTDTTYSEMEGATSWYSGKSGLVPAPSSGNSNRYLAADGTWKELTNSNVTLNDLGVTASADELNYVDGVTTNIQDQLNNKAGLGHVHYANSVYMSSGGDVESKINQISSDTIKMMTVVSNNFDMTANRTQPITVNYNLPSMPKVVIAQADGGAPFECSVNYWSETSATIGVKSTEALYNRRARLIIFY